MSLRDLIRKGGLAKLATATPATIATDRQPVKGRAVAEVAAVAVASQPIPSDSSSLTALTAEQADLIATWLARIGETDSQTIAEVMDQSREDPVCRATCLKMAEDIPRQGRCDDDRRHCHQCSNRTLSGRCLAAYRGEIIASDTYCPVDDIPRRCEGYVPRKDEADQRCGQERWPWLKEEEF